MIIKRETVVFLTSLAIIFIIGYVNMTMSNTDVFNEKDYAKHEQKTIKEQGGASVANIEDIADITDITDITDVTDMSDMSGGETEAATANADTEGINVAFETFKISKDKSNLGLVDHIEKNLTNEIISQETKAKLESLLVTKNNYIKLESGIELMLQSKGYNETVAVVDENMVKVITNDKIEQADAVKILDVVVNETNYEPSKVKIVKFNNAEKIAEK